jgi:hypothetical protein
MIIVRKYAFVLAMVVAVIYVYAPLSREDIAKLRWLDDINAIINKSLALTKREVRVSPVDSGAAANVHEDLDYRIAERMKSIEGWRSFLGAHPDGPHAQSARAELDKLVPPEKPPTPVAVEAPNGGSPETETPSEATSPSQLYPGSEVAAPTTDEVCGRDQDHLERLSNSRSRDEAIRLLTELRCETLRPQLFRLTEHLDYQDPPPAAVATHALVARWRVTEPQNGARWTVASRSLQLRRPANGWTGRSLPPIFLALFGQEPRNSTTFQRGVGVRTSKGVGGAASTSGARGGGGGSGAGGGSGSGAGGGGGSASGGAAGGGGAGGGGGSGGGNGGGNGNGVGNGNGNGNGGGNGNGNGNGH